VPVLALTATATPRVVTDIQDKLGFPARNVFQKSFERKNLTYLVIREEDKLGRMTRILKKVQGPSIVYVRNRKKSGEIAALLNRSGIRSTFYHAGLDMKTRESRQVSWMKEEHRVMVATNAFGMGIDKPNVRLVLHLDLPDSPEAYFQEAGRGGRDGKRSYAVVLFNEADLAQAGQNLSREFPPLDSIRIVYKSLANELKIPAGSGKDESYDFDLSTVAKRSGLSSIITFNCLRLLEKEGYIRLNEATGAPSRICFSCGREDLYRYQVENIEMDRFIKVILRSYSGVFTSFVAVNEKEIAQRSGLGLEEVIRRLDLLRKKGLMDYTQQTDKPQVIFTVERLDDRHIRISPENYKTRKNIAREKMQSMLDYVTGDRVCRSQFLLGYFGEESTARCGRCDVCRQRNKLSLNEVEFDRIHESVFRLLNEKSMTLPEIVFYTRPFSEDAVLKVVRWLEDHGAVVKDEKLNYALQRQFRRKI
jgi:ATP-dependent DNA helicase RecQ